MVVKEVTSFGLSGPEADSRPSKHVILLVRAALRYALASASFRESLTPSWILEIDRFKKEEVMW